MMDAISAAHDGDIQMIDSTSVRAHQQAATAKRGGADHCLGRSRGGLTTKIHVVVDAQGLPIRLGLTAGQTHDGQIADTLLAAYHQAGRQHGPQASLRSGQVDPDAYPPILRAESWGPKKG
jgi:transposase